MATKNNTSTLLPQQGNYFKL